MKNSEIKQEAKNLLSENRTCVINAIKWYYTKSNLGIKTVNYDLKEEMNRFLDYMSDRKRLDFVMSVKYPKSALKQQVYACWLQFRKELAYNAPTPSYLQGHSDINDLMSAIKRNTRNKIGI